MEIYPDCAGRNLLLRNPVLFSYSISKSTMIPWRLGEGVVRQAHQPTFITCLSLPMDYLGYVLAGLL